MKKKFVEPEIVKIELNMTENIATSVQEEETPVMGFLMRQEAGTPGGCRMFYVKTDHGVINEHTLMEIYFKGCISDGSEAEQQVLRMMR